MGPRTFICLTVVSAALPASAFAGDPASAGRARVRISWGHAAPAAAERAIAVEGRGLRLEATPFSLEGGEGFRDGAWRTRAGGGDADGLDLALDLPERPPASAPDVHPIWAHLLASSDPETVRRLRGDSTLRPDPRRISVRVGEGGSRGFSVTATQLLEARSLWVPSLDIYLAAGDPPEPFEAYRARLAASGRRRVLESVRSAPEASFEEFADKWEDMGSPHYRNPHQVGPGHIVCLAWDGSLAKFGVDRAAGVWNDYGNPDRFRLRLEAEGVSDDLVGAWRGQSLARGLPVVTTVFERGGLRWEVEQFAHPLADPPSERRGDIPMVLFERVRVAELEGRARAARVSFVHEREIPEGGRIERRAVEGPAGRAGILEEGPSGRILLAVRGEGIAVEGDPAPPPSPPDWSPRSRRASISIRAELAPRAQREVFVALPSPPLAPGDRDALLGLDHDAARASTLRFWSDWLERGASFEVPEERVNDLFRATLWHALRLSRRHEGPDGRPRLDLPYSNFAYDQSGAPWPVNQAVYVDSMIYDLRGHHDVSAEELESIYAQNQEPDGRVRGYANWGVYTPSMLYAVARHFLLSGDRASFERLRPATSKALDWCLRELRRASERAGPGSGLVLAPLNDLSHEERAWAFNQAYVYAGVDLLGRALAAIGDPRAAECRDAARRLAEAAEREFGRASIEAPLVELRDGTWSPYVPSDALAPRRLFEVWYPTDVDTGALHLPRLGALDPEGHLATCLLEDHEDNLYLSGLGMANEPVYNQQAMVYLLRDDVLPAIRAFYSMMACAFSHGALEPVEHRWGWGQYFGPPSTSGAWFELYRHMLIREREDGSLLLLGATPRRWLADGKRIRVARAPTWYGPVSFELESRAALGEIRVRIEARWRKRPEALLVRIRHPGSLPPEAVTVDGEERRDFDAEREWVRIPAPASGAHAIVARFAPGAR